MSTGSRQFRASFATRTITLPDLIAPFGASTESASTGSPIPRLVTRRFLSASVRRKPSIAGARKPSSSPLRQQTALNELVDEHAMIERIILSVAFSLLHSVVARMLAEILQSIRVFGENLAVAPRETVVAQHLSERSYDVVEFAPVAKRPGRPSHVLQLSFSSWFAREIRY